MKFSKRNSEPEDATVKKIKEIYSNYGVDILDMTEDEFLRLKEQYAQKAKGSLKEDLKKSRLLKALIGDKFD